MSRSREPFSSLMLYRLTKWLAVKPILHGYFRARIYGVEHVPQEGKLIVVSNHASDLDPPILAVCVSRPVAYMAKEELFQVPVLKQVVQMYGAYPVKRGSADRSAIRSALESLDNGWAAGLFLAGTRTADGRIPDPKLGAALIAAKVQAPLLPVSIWGTHAILPKGATFPRSVPVTIRIGEVIPPPRSGDREELEAVTQQCTQAIHAMHDLGR
jgi:1-acyl-sn-glycerol-3-phosphate acyltransferase